MALPSACHTGPGCSKPTMLLVNLSLKFQTLLSEICHYFLLKNVRSFCSAKASHIFSTKNISGFGYKVVKHLRSWPLNELVKLTMLWTTGPRIVDLGYFYMHFWLKWFKLCIQAICAENLSALNLPVTLRQINVIKICISDKSPCGLENRSWSSELLWFMPLINWYMYLCKFGGSPHNGPKGTVLTRQWHILNYLKS